MGPMDDVYRRLEELGRAVALMQKTIMRQGTVQSVDALAGTVVVQFAGEDAAGQPLLSLPVPWLQRSTEHRPPAVGDHALVLDPSLGNGAGVAFTGWPSTAKPPADGGTQRHVLYAGDDTVRVKSKHVELGVDPDDYPALASRVDAELARIWGVLTDPSIVPAVAAGTDAGEPGLTLLLSGASGEAAQVQSVAATQVKVK